MAYGLLLYKELTSPLGDQRVEIYKDGYTGDAVEIAGLHRDGLTIAKDSGDIAQAITTSVLTIALSDCEEIDYTQFFTPNATMFKVVWKTKVESAWETRWTGFITPDSFSENLAYRDTLTLTARDNLGRLGDYDFDLTRGQLLSIRSILTQGLTKAGVAMTMTVTTTKVATSPATTLAIDGLVNTSLLQGMTWREALELLLTGIGCTLAWNDGNAFEVRDISQAPATSQPAFFVYKSGFRQIQPAWKNLTIEQDFGRRDNFYEGQFSKADCGGVGPSVKTFTPPSGSPWASDFALLNPYNGARNPVETIFIPVGNEDTIAASMTYSQWVPQLNRAITLSMRCSNSTWKVNNLGNAIWAQKTIQTGVSPSGGFLPIKREYALRYRFNIFMTVGATKYVLRETWEEYDPATIEAPYLYFSMPGSGQGVDMDEEVNIYIGEIPGSGTLELVVYKPLAYPAEDTGSGDPISYSNPNDYGRITEITMAVDEGVGARAKRVAINADHNVQGGVSVRVGQVSTSLGNALLYLGGIFYTDNDHTPLTGFARAANGANFDLLELVGREYISYNNDNYDALSGTMMAGAAFRFDKAISFGEKTYRIVGASLAILSNTLSAQMLQEEADFDTTDYTIETVDDEGRTTTTGGTGSIGQGQPSGGDRFFEALQQSGETIGAKALYDLYIALQGSGSGSGSGDTMRNISELLRHLSLRVVNVGQADESTIVYCDLTIASAGNLVAGGLAGSGSGSGDGGSLAGLVDVALSGLTGGQLLRYNATTQHWENITPLLSGLADISIEGTPTNGQVLEYNATLGKWVAATRSNIEVDSALSSSSTNPVQNRVVKAALDAVGKGSYVNAWNGDATPVVGDIPAGVVVSYGGTDYTGTLAASASTTGKIYLVKNGTEYDRYITSVSGSSYSWEKIGTTAVTIPIVDDLMTGGSTSALSAEQGKILNENFEALAYDDDVQTVNTSAYAKYTYNIAPATGKWGNAAAYQYSREIPVPDDIDFIILTPTGSTMMWSLLSAFSQPSNGAQAPIVSGTDNRYTASVETRITDLTGVKYIVVRSDDAGHNYAECPVIKFVRRTEFKAETKARLDANEAAIRTLESQVYTGEPLAFGSLRAGYIKDDGKWLVSPSDNTHLSAHYLIGITEGNKYRIDAGTLSGVAYWLSSNAAASNNATAAVVGTKITIPADDYKIVEAPAGAKYLYVAAAYQNNVLTPSSVQLIIENATLLDRIIPDYYVNSPQEIDLQALTQQNGSMGGGRTWVTSGGAKHRAFSVVPGDKYVISGDGQGFWCWLTSSYSPPYSAGAAIPYVSGYQRTLQKGAVAVTVPSGAAYLAFTVVNGAGVEAGWTMFKVASYQRKRNFYVRLKYASWNIGLFVYTDWNVGDPTHEIPAGQAAEYAQKYRELINDVDADILGICEYDPSFSAAGLTTRDTIFSCYSQLYQGAKDGANCNTLMFNGDIEFVGKEEIPFTTREANRYYTHITARLAGENVHLVQAHLDHTYNEKRVAQIQQLIADFAGFKYVIIAGDFNTGDEETVDTELSLLKTAGYTLANDGYLGLVVTSLTQEYVDNICVRGFAMSKIGVRQDSGTLSDHLLVEANLKMNFDTDEQ